MIQLITKLNHLLGWKGWGGLGVIVTVVTLIFTLPNNTKVKTQNPTINPISIKSLSHKIDSISLLVLSDKKELRNKIQQKAITDLDNGNVIDTIELMKVNHQLELIEIDLYELKTRIKEENIDDEKLKEFDLITKEIIQDINNELN